MFTNGFGGGSFPQRFNAPNSQQVMSDSEFQADWNSRLANIPKFTGGEGAQLVTSAADYDPTAANPYQTSVFDSAARDQLKNLGISYENQSSDLLDSYKQSIGGKENFFSGGNNAYSAGYSGGGSHLVGQNNGTLNPEYSRMDQLLQTESRNRRENQIAQQQAYDGMSDQYQKNGVMGEDYTNPNFGVIDGLASTGNEANPMWTTGLIDEGSQTGVYDPLASTENNFWGL